MDATASKRLTNEDCTRIKSEYRISFQKWLEEEFLGLKQPVLTTIAHDQTRRKVPKPFVFPREAEYVECVKRELVAGGIDRKLDRIGEHYDSGEEGEEGGRSPERRRE